MLVHMICMLVVGWLALLFPGSAAAQPATNSTSAICGVDIENQKWDALEVACLRQLGKRAGRKGDLLTLRLENGGSKEYRNDARGCENNDECISYWLVAYHPEARVYSVAIGYYEGRGVELLGARTGNVLRLTGIPYFSADGSRFVAIDNDEAYGGDYDLSVGSNTNGSLSLDWQYKSNEGGPLEWRLERWIDNDHVAMRVFSSGTDKKCPDNDCDAMLVRFGNSWMVRRLPAKQ